MQIQCNKQIRWYKHDKIYWEKNIMCAISLAARYFLRQTCENRYVEKIREKWADRIRIIKHFTSVEYEPSWLSQARKESISLKWGFLKHKGSICHLDHWKEITFTGFGWNSSEFWSLVVTTRSTLPLWIDWSNRSWGQTRPCTRKHQSRMGGQGQQRKLNCLSVCFRTAWRTDQPTDRRTDRQSDL